MSSTVAPRERSHKRPREALQEGTDRAHAAQVLAELVADVAGVEVRKHEDIGLARDIARALDLERGDPRHDGGIRLELAVDRELRGPRADDLHGAADLLDPFVLARCHAWRTRASPPAR